MLGVQAGPTYTIRIPSRLHLPAAQDTLTASPKTPAAATPTPRSPARSSHESHRDAMLRGILDGPPPLTQTDRAAAHGKLLLTALYEPDLRKRRTARRAIALLLGLADDA